MAGYKVCAVVDVRNATIMIDPVNPKTGEKTDRGVVLAFKMNVEGSNAVLLNDEDIENLFAAIREVQRLRDSDKLDLSIQMLNEEP